MSCIIGVDIGGTYARIGAVSKNGNVIAMKKVKQNQIFNGENVIEQLIRFLDTFMTSTEDVRDVQAIAIGFPATLDKNRTKVVQAPNISGIDHTEIVEPLEKYFNLPVFIEKDVCMALFYDACKYHLSLDGITVACYIGTGIGNAICIHGEVLTGKDGAACELGHIPILGNREKCGCGNEGCLENIAGGKALNRLCRDVFKDTQVSDIFPKRRKRMKFKLILMQFQLLLRQKLIF